MTRRESRRRARDGRVSVASDGVASVWSDVDGLRMHARTAVRPVSADASEVVLMHGLGVSGRYMIPTLLRLAGEYWVWAPDLPGFGASPKPRGLLTLGELADALAAWMTANGLDQAALLGNSLGCQVIRQFAARHQERLTAAVLVSPTMDPGARGPLGQALRLLVDAPREARPLPRIAVGDYLRAGPIRMWRTLREALHDPIGEYCSPIRVPALVVRGGRDPIVSQRWAEQVADVLPRGRLVVIPGAPHAVNFSAPDALARAVRAFLDDVARGSSVLSV